MFLCGETVIVVDNPIQHMELFQLQASLAKQVNPVTNLLALDLFHTARIAENSKEASELFGEIQSDLVDINMVIYPDDRFLFIALRNNNLPLLQFLLVQSQLVIEPARLQQ